MQFRNFIILSIGFLLTAFTAYSQAPNWSVVGNGSIIEIVVGDVKNDTSNNYRVTVGETSEEFNIAFKVDNLKMMQRDYNVAVSSKGISHFTTEKGDLSYFVATESK